MCVQTDRGQRLIGESMAMAEAGIIRVLELYSGIGGMTCALKGKPFLINEEYTEE